MATLSFSPFLCLIQKICPPDVMSDGLLMRHLRVTSWPSRTSATSSRRLPAAAAAAAPARGRETLVACHKKLICGGFICGEFRTREGRQRQTEEADGDLEGRAQAERTMGGGVLRIAPPPPPINTHHTSTI